MTGTKELGQTTRRKSHIKTKHIFPIYTFYKDFVAIVAITILPFAYKIISPTLVYKIF